MKKQKVSLKKLQLTKSKVSYLNASHVTGGGTIFFLTDNGCGPEKSVWPDICPISHNCPPASNACPTYACQTVFCQSTLCDQTAGCPTNTPTLAC